MDEQWKSLAELLESIGLNPGQAAWTLEYGLRAMAEKGHADQTDREEQATKVFEWRALQKT